MALRCSRLARDSVEVYQVTKLGCRDAGPTYSYFSRKDGTKLRSTENKLNNDGLAAGSVSHPDEDKSPCRPSTTVKTCNRYFVNSGSGAPLIILLARALQKYLLRIGSCTTADRDSAVLCSLNSWLE